MFLSLSIPHSFSVSKYLINLDDAQIPPNLSDRSAYQYIFICFPLSLSLPPFPRYSLFSCRLFNKYITRPPARASLLNIGSESYRCRAALAYANAFIIIPQGVPSCSALPKLNTHANSNNNEHEVPSSTCKTLLNYPRLI